MYPHLTNPCERTFTLVEGVQIETLAWGKRGAPGILLIHGFGASADWWSFTAPALAEVYRVAACSFSGNGRSGWRDAYDIDLLKREALACGMAAGTFESGSAAIVAHSFGATVGARLSLEASTLAGAFVVVDRPLEQPSRLDISRLQRRERKRFASMEVALGQFSPRPLPLCADPEIVDYLARASIEEIGAGPERYWSWRQDPNLRLKLTERQTSIADEIAAMDCPTVFLRGEHSSFFTHDEANDMRRQGMRVVNVPGAAHHLMLDQPLVTAAAIGASAACLMALPPAS